jgi:hypothetical protein
VAAVRGLLAFWAGGAVTGADPASAAPRSLLAFWAGGACIGVVPEPEAPPATGGSVWRPPTVWADGLREKRITNDDLLLLLAAEIAAGLLH